MTTPADRDDWLDDSVRQVLAERAANPGEHPDAEYLLDYHLRTLSTEEEEQVAEHLARCAECARLVLDYDAFATPVPEEEAPPRADLDQAWGRFEARRSRASVSRPLWQSETPAWALAASLLLCTGLFAWGLAAHRRPAPEAEPSPRVASAYLDPLGKGMARAGEAPRPIEVVAGTEKIHLVLGFTTERADTLFRMELLPLAQPDRVLWSDGDAPRQGRGGFGVEIPVRFVPAGKYAIRILSRQGEPLAEYHFEVVPGGPAP